MIFRPASNNPPAFLKRGLGGVKKTSEVNILRLTFIFLFSFPLIACAGGRTIHWQQEVKLNDSRVMQVKRISKQSGNIFPENVILDLTQTLSFTNPDTQEKIIWKIPEGLMPRMIDFDQRTPYILFASGSVADYNTWNCPNPLLRI